MIYQEFNPGSKLAQYIECFWSIQAEGVVSEYAHRVIPDGCIDLLFDIGSNPLFSKKTPYVVGAMTKAAIVNINPNNQLLGIRFLPTGAYLFFGKPMHELIDQSITLEEFEAKHLLEIEHVFEENSLEEKISYLKAFLESRLYQSIEPKKLSQLVANKICTTQGQIRVEDLSQIFGVSRQYLTRQFTAEVGLSPKAFARIIKMKATNEVLTKKNDCLNYADLAIEQGYFDQAHLISEYQSLVGLTPNQYRKIFGNNL